MPDTTSQVAQLAQRQTVGWRVRVRQVAWASFPVWSLGLLAFAPFLTVALTRRRGRDWAVCIAYLAAIVLLLAAANATGPGNALVSGLFIAFMVVATVHAAIAFRPAAALPRYKDARAIRVADKLEAAAAAREQTRQQAAEARSRIAASKQARHDERKAARAATAEAAAAKRSEQTARKAATAEAAAAKRSEQTARKAATAEAAAAKRSEQTARKAATAEAAAAKRSEQTARKAATAEAAAAKRSEQTARKAATAEAAAAKRSEQTARKAEQKAEWREKIQRESAARAAAPRYGWVETRRTYRHETIFGNHRTETIVSSPSQRNARRRTRQRFGVKITEEWRRID